MVLHMTVTVVIICTQESYSYWHDGWSYGTVLSKSNGFGQSSSSNGRKKITGWLQAKVRI